jgi:hypothetical protein
MGKPIRPQPSTAIRRPGEGEGVKGVSIIVVVGRALKISADTSSDAMMRIFFHRGLQIACKLEAEK